MATSPPLGRGEGPPWEDEQQGPHNQKGVHGHAPYESAADLQSLGYWVEGQGLFAALTIASGGR